MAKILVEFDTVEKTLSASIDGKAVADVYGVSLYRGWADDDDVVPYRCELTTRSEDDTNKLCRYTSVVASDGTTTTTPAKPADPPAEDKKDLAADVEQYLSRE